MSQQEIEKILRKCKTIAVVGLSDNKNKHSYVVAAYLQQNGYRIIPINPNVKEVLGEISYPSLLDAPADIKRIIEIVDIFRRPQYIMHIVKDAIKIKRQYERPYVIWIQSGVVNPLAANRALGAGFVVISDKCMMVEHQNLL